MNYFIKRKKKIEIIQICTSCEQLNPPSTNYCWKCGSKELFTDEKIAKKLSRKAKRRYFFRTKPFLYIVSLIISIGISLGLILGIASKYIIVQGFILAIMTISFGLVLSWFVFVFIGYFVYRK